MRFLHRAQSLVFRLLWRSILATLLLRFPIVPLGGVSKGKELGRRLLFYNDARHHHIYNSEPPMSLEQARLPVDEIAGTSVDTLVYGFGPGPTMFHLTRVGEIFGERLETFTDIAGVHRGTVVAWRAYENIMSLKRQGFDLLKVLIDRSHEKGIEFYASIRQSHPADPSDVNNYFNWQFRIDHPEWCLKGEGEHAFNWIHPEVRAERLAIIEETVNRYDIVGLEIDWCFWPFFFEDSEVEQNSAILTVHMRRIREIVERAAEKRGRQIVLGARVLPVLSGNQRVGVDVSTWIKEGLLDFVVPLYYVAPQIDTDYPFDWLVDLARGTRCRVYPALWDRVGRPPEEDTEPVGQQQAAASHYYAGAAAYWDKGADGLYLPRFRWPIGPRERGLLSEISQVDLLKGKPKHYVVRGHHEGSAGYGYRAQLPLILTPGLDAPGQTVTLFIADNARGQSVTLRVRLHYTTSHDLLTVSLNGQRLPKESSRRTSHGYSPTEAPNGRGLGYGIPHSWLEYPVPSGLLRKGRNQVGIALHSRPSNLAGEIVVGGVELIVQ